MKQYLKTAPWQIIEEAFHPSRMRASESIFSLGNGRFGQRGNFEEQYSSDSLQGSYLAGVTFLDKTKVGWWKNGYPRFFSRIPNAPDWSGMRIRLIDEELDLAVWDVQDYLRQLDMKSGISYRSFVATSPKGNTLSIKITHLNHMMEPNLCMIRFEVKSINYSGKLSVVPYLDANVKHESANYDKQMWTTLRSETKEDVAYLWTQVKREDTQVCMAMGYQAQYNGEPLDKYSILIEKEQAVGYNVGCQVKPNDTLKVDKFVTIVSSLYESRNDIVDSTVSDLRRYLKIGWDELIKDHQAYWRKLWNDSDVVIQGDEQAQQGIRFNIFQLHQSYQGRDHRLNIAAKGFTGEFYGGNTFWNTELCCLPYFLLSSRQDIARNLLLYREAYLQKAIANARKLGIGGGAALYPMMTITGEESHNEWEITFEEIHRNSIMAYAIVQYIYWSGDIDYLTPHGLRVLIAICRFWALRVTWSQRYQCYMLLGVTGPNEYENNVDNNWYTNFSCQQTLLDTLKMLKLAHQHDELGTQAVLEEVQLADGEQATWQEIADKMYLHQDEKTSIFIQQDGYLNKVMQNVDEIPSEERPINQHWSWDRILRSCFIKQSDVLLGLYLYRDHFDQETIRKNYEFYAPKTVHESSLSPYVHCILAARLGKLDEAYNLFLQATRMDLDDYNHEVNAGLHVTSMAGSWMALAHGFAGMMLKEKVLTFEPVMPSQWTCYELKVNYLDCAVKVIVHPDAVDVLLLDGEELLVRIYDKTVLCKKKVLQTIVY